jgi:hypothetical protein
MIKIILTILLAGIIMGNAGGCGSTPVLYTPQGHVITIPEEMFNCPSLTKQRLVSFVPDLKRMTNQQLGRLILELKGNNDICKNSIETIRRHIDNAKQTIEK